MKQKINLILTIVLSLYSSYNMAQENNEISQDYLSKLPNLMSENKVPCVSICFIEDGEVTHAEVYGELRKGVPAPQNTVFNIASMTKPIVAVLTLKLVESGQWNLDYPVYKYWIDPDVRNDSLLKKLTTRHILTHQSGLPNWRGSNKLKFDFEPGTKYQYSGEGFEYLRKALENKFNSSLSSIADSVLFRPLGMSSTFFASNDSIRNRMAFGHDGNNIVYEGQTWNQVNAAGSILTTAENLGKFVIYVMNGAGLSQALFNEMVRPQVQLKEHVAKGLGWGLISDLPGNEYAMEHGGSNPGFQSMMIILPNSKRAIVVLTNSDNGMFVYNSIIEDAFVVGRDIVNLSHDSYQAKVISMSNEVLDQYVGTYNRSDVNGYRIYISREDNDLVISGDAIPTIKLLPEAENKFFTKGLPYEYEFVKNEHNDILQLNISEKGKLLLHATKTK